ncbi:hypothetical protein ScalyP_jg722 [Parmales sp. scaly parma]|nr:hypothetical protein ScalyP_jg722 [Parmales sp. scaly parma]
MRNLETCEIHVLKSILTRMPHENEARAACGQRRRPNSAQAQTGEFGVVDDNEDRPCRTATFGLLLLGALRARHACSIYVNITMNRSVLISPPTNFLSPSYASGTGSQNTLSAVVTQQQSLYGEIFSLTNSTFNQVERSEPKKATRSFSTYSQ